MSADVLELFPDGPPERTDPPRSVLGEVRQYRGRVFHRSRGCTGTGPDDLGRCCPSCDWGAFQCAVCGGAEGEVPTDCPGRLMSESERDSVLAGDVDYVQAAGGWIDASRYARERGGA